MTFCLRRPPSLKLPQGPFGPSCIRGHRKNRREGEAKKCDRVGVKIWLQGGHLEQTGRGYGRGTLFFKHHKEKIIFSL